jgi:hypothetical protein
VVKSNHNNQLAKINHQSLHPTNRIQREFYSNGAIAPQELFLASSHPRQKTNLSKPKHPVGMGIYAVRMDSTCFGPNFAIFCYALSFLVFLCFVLNSIIEGRLCSPIITPQLPISSSILKPMKASLP